jgi:hypothetical protein
LQGSAFTRILNTQCQLSDSLASLDTQAGAHALIATIFVSLIARTGFEFPFAHLDGHIILSWILTNTFSSAFIAFSKGHNDLEVVNLTSENSMFKAQSRYLLDRADSELWAFVLSENNMHRRSVIDQVISTAVPECTEPEKVSVAVQSFLAADLPAELIELLEKIILEPSPFSDNGNLQASFRSLTLVCLANIYSRISSFSLPQRLTRAVCLTTFTA